MREPDVLGVGAVVAGLGMLTVGPGTVGGWGAQLVVATVAAVVGVLGLGVYTAHRI